MTKTSATTNSSAVPWKQDLAIVFDQALNIEVSESAGSMPDCPGFEVAREIGRGGMGVVYEAIQQRPRRSVALKVVHASSTLSVREYQLFMREADILAKLSHPNIAHCYGCGQSHDGALFLVMEYVQGFSLRDYLVRYEPDQHQRLDLFCQIAEAVRYVHEQGIIHRDLKPSNLIVNEAGHVKLIDFGLAHMPCGQSMQVSHNTTQARFLGTPGYMSPEQTRSRNSAVDARTDVYSLGVMLYEMMTGQLPIDVQQCSPIEIIERICESVPPLAGEHDTKLRGDLEAIIAKSLCKDPNDRYANVNAMLSDIRLYLDNGSVSVANPRNVVQALYRRFQASTLHFAAVALLLCSLIGTTGLLLSSRSTSTEQRYIAMALEQISFEHWPQTEQVLIELIERGDLMSAYAIAKRWYDQLYKKWTISEPAIVQSRKVIAAICASQGDYRPAAWHYAGIRRAHTMKDHANSVGSKKYNKLFEQSRRAETDVLFAPQFSEQHTSTFLLELLQDDLLK